MTVEHAGVRVTGDVLLVRPGIVHSVWLGRRGADVVYLNGLAFPFDAPLAVALKGELDQLACRSLGGDPCATEELRARLAFATDPLPAKVAEIVRAMQADPMRRVSQDELVESRHGANAGAALLQGGDGADVPPVQAVVGAAACGGEMAERELVRTAAMDAGFADTAHLSRVFSSMFGCRPAWRSPGSTSGNGN